MTRIQKIISTLVVIFCLFGVASQAQAIVVSRPVISPVHVVVPIIILNSSHSFNPSKYDQCKQPPVSWHWYGAYKVQHRKINGAWQRLSQVRRGGQVVSYKAKRSWDYQGRAYFRNFPWEKSWWSSWKTMCKGTEMTTLKA